MNQFLLFILFAILFMVAGWIIWAFLKTEAKRKPKSSFVPRRSMADSIEQLPFQVDSKTGDFKSLAESAYRQGDFRNAAIYLFSHVLVMLDQTHLIRLRKGKTNRQYLRELKPHQAVGLYFKQVMEPFESVFYGNHSLAREEFEACWNDLPSFESRITRNAQEVL